MTPWLAPKGQVSRGVGVEPCSVIGRKSLRFIIALLARLGCVEKMSFCSTNMDIIGQLATHLILSSPVPEMKTRSQAYRN